MLQLLIVFLYIQPLREEMLDAGSGRHQSSSDYRSRLKDEDSWKYELETKADIEDPESLLAVTPKARV